MYTCTGIRQHFEAVKNSSGSGNDLSSLVVEMLQVVSVSVHGDSLRTDGYWASGGWLACITFFVLLRESLFSSIERSERGHEMRTLILLLVSSLRQACFQIIVVCDTAENFNMIVNDDA